MGCRINIWPVDKDGTLTFDAALGRKYRLYDCVESNFVTNKSRTAFLEYCSRRAAERGHDKYCKHESLENEWCGDPSGLEPLSVLDGVEKARDNATEVSQSLRDAGEEVCDYCQEDGSVDYPLAEWITLSDRDRMAHARCGLDAGWRLA